MNGYTLGTIKIDKIACASIAPEMITTKSEEERKQEQAMKKYCKIIMNRLTQIGHTEGSPFLAERFRKKKLTFQGFFTIKGERVFKFVYRNCELKHTNKGLSIWGKRDLVSVISKTMLEEIAFANLTVFDSKTKLGATNYMALNRPLKKEEKKMEESKITTEQNVEEIDHPSRYCKGKVECIDAIEAATSNLVGIQAVDTGAVIRYLWRWADKGGIRDLEKAKNYIDFLIKDIQENGIRKQ